MTEKKLQRVVCYLREPVLEQLKAYQEREGYTSISQCASGVIEKYLEKFGFTQFPHSYPRDTEQ